MFSLFMIKLTFGCIHCCRDGIVNSPMNSCSCLIPAYVPNVSLCDTKCIQERESKRSALLYILLDLTLKKSRQGLMSCRVSAPHASVDKPSLGITISTLHLYLSQMYPKYTCYKGMGKKRSEVRSHTRTSFFVAFFL